MDFSLLRKQLTNLTALVERWEEQGYAPDIELNIARGRLSDLYDTLLEANPSPLAPRAMVATEQIKPPVEKIEPEATEGEEQEEVACEEPEATEGEEQEEVVAEEAVKEEEQEEVVYEAPEDDEVEVEFAEEDKFSQDQEESVEEEQVEEEQVGEDEQESVSQNDQRYAAELFGGDLQYFNSEVSKMLAMGSVDDMIIYISESYDWSADSVTAQDFINEMVDKFC